MPRRRGTTIAWGLAALALIAGGPVIAALAAQPPAPIGNCRYFVATGHYVCDEFLRFYDELSGDTILGQPLSEAYPDDARGVLVQYFERARLEARPQSDGTQIAQLGALIEELGYAFPRLDPEEVPQFATALQRYYHDSGHTVSLAFLEFYLEHGGPDTFGLPISEVMFADGFTVQYFERARMEWHPEAEPRPEVRVSKLAEANLQRFGVPSSMRDPLPPPPSVLSAEGEPVRAAVREVRVSASVGTVIAGAGRAGEQSVHVFVIDQQGGPVKDVAVTAAVRYREGRVTYNLWPTDEAGYTGQVFKLGASTPGERIVIDVHAIHDELVGRTQTFFMAWW